MKRTKILYWIFTILFVAFMAYSAVPDVILSEQAIAFMNGFLGIPNYMTQFIGIAKLLGCVVLLIPAFPRLKEWAYAGFAFDLLGAFYWVVGATLAKDMPLEPPLLFMLVPIGLGAASYFLYHKMRREQMEKVVVM